VSLNNQYGCCQSRAEGLQSTAIYLAAEGLSCSNLVASTECMFAPYYGNSPDDRSFLQRISSFLTQLP
jgi:hypothetical protein